MFKFLKRKKIQDVSRVEDLQVGDKLQVDMYRCGIVDEIIRINKRMMHIRLSGITPGNITREKSAVTLHQDLKVFVWR